MANSRKRILIIKHGALGDIIIASAGFKAIRAAHPDAHITCLTSAAFASLMRQCPWFDDVIVDEKPRFTSVHKLWRLWKILRNRRYDWIYDLQASTRSTFYLLLLPNPAPNISGVASRVSHSYCDSERHNRHAYDNLKRQLSIAGIDNLGAPDISWLEEAIDLPCQPYALLVAGGAAHRPQKRWPAKHYATLATHLLDAGIQPVLIGSTSEEETLKTISTLEARVINLCGKTSLAQLANLARNAAFACGNDTGPMHIIAATNCPSLILFSDDSSPKRSAPVGNQVHCLQEANLNNLSLEHVLEAMNALPKRARQLDK